MIIRFCLTCIFLSAIFLTEAQGEQFLKQASVEEAQGAWYKAGISYDRVLFCQENQEQVIIAVSGKLRCLKKQQQFREAGKFIKENYQLIDSDSIRYRLYEQWILCAYLSDQQEEAISLADQALLLYPQYCNQQWLLYFKILCLNELNEWTMAQQNYKQWLAGYKIDSAEAIIYEKLPVLKSENKAAWLSTVLPGGGQWYAGKPLETMTSILIQGLGIYYGIVSFETKYYLSAWLVGGGVFGSFHFGSVRRAEELVRQYNKKKAASFNSTLRQKISDQMNQHL